MELHYPFPLDRFQQEAIASIESGSSVVVSAPTGAGKTLIAEYVITRSLQNQKGIVYTAPIKALSNQKFRDFSLTYGDRVGILTGDVSLNPDALLVIMTTEIFRNVILSDPERLRNKEWIIFDEIHYLDDVERGTVWEEALMLLPKHMKIIALSATVPNVREISSWMSSIHHFPIKTIIEYTRPVPLSIFFQCNNRIFNHVKALERENILVSSEKKLFQRRHSNRLQGTRPNKIYALFEMLQKKNHLPCIYFSFSRKKTEMLAEEVAGHFNFLTAEESVEISELYSQLLSRFDLSAHAGACFLKPFIQRGVAFHHAGLLPSLKEVIEVLFSSRKLKAIFTTETFALGINMPARAVVFDDIKKFSGTFHRYLKTRDFYQIAGRAGRRGIDNNGFVYLRVSSLGASLEGLKRIIYGRPEEIESQLKSNYATLLNLYRDMGEKIYDIYPLSFHFFSASEKEKQKAVELTRRKITLLKELGYITETKRLSFKGELASHLYSYELPLGELYERGFFEAISSLQLAILFSALVYEPRRGQEKPRLSHSVRRVFEATQAIDELIFRREKNFRIYPASKQFAYHLAEPVRLWFEGIAFAQLEKITDIDEGELIRYFRMVLQLAREFMSFPGFSSAIHGKARECFLRMNRDEVDAERQLRQSLE